MKDKIEEKLSGIYMMQKTNDETEEQETIYVFTGDDEETAHDASLKVLMDYFIRLENQTNLVTRILKQKATDPNMSPEDAFNVIEKMDQIISRMEM